MTEETLPEPPREPLEGRLLNVAGGLLALAFWLVLLWEQLEPDGPKEWLARLCATFAERRRYREAMRETLIDIEELPEVERDLVDDELEGGQWSGT